MNGLTAHELIDLTFDPDSWDSFPELLISTDSRSIT